MPDDLKTVTVIPRYQEGTFVDAFILPVVRSLFVSFLLALIVLVISARWVKLSFWDCMLAFFLTLLISTIVGFSLESKYWLWLIESVMLKDVDGDGQVGPPQPVQRQPDLTVYLDDGRGHGRREDLPFGDRLPLLARGLLNGRDFTQAEWTGKARGKPFSRPEWEELMRALEKGNLAHKIIPGVDNSPYKLTEEGKKVFMKLALRGSAGLEIYQPSAMQVSAFDTEPLSPPPDSWYRHS